MQNVKNLIRTVLLKDFESEFTSLIKAKKPFFGYFTGSISENGVSWCPDCETAKPNIEKGVKELEGSEIEFIVFPLDREPYKKSDFHLRTNPKTKLTAVPTLIFYNDGIEFGRMVEDELFDETKVITFMKQALDL